LQASAALWGGGPPSTCSVTRPATYRPAAAARPLLLARLAARPGIAPLLTATKVNRLAADLGTPRLCL
jgi:hypothetical protein